MIVPIQVEGKLHVLDVPTIEDYQNLIANGTDPENVKTFHYWMQQINDFARRIGMESPLPLFDDTVFLGYIEWMWFLKELEMWKR